MTETRLLAAALVFLLPLAAAPLVAAISFATGRALVAPSPFVVLGAAAATAWGMVLAFRRAGRSQLGWVGAGAAVIAVGGLLVRATFDVSWDGQGWHAFVIERLAGGWNPYRVRLAPEGQLFNTIANHYPKLVETAAAAIAAWTGRIDHGRILQFAAIPPAFLVSLACFLRMAVPRRAAIALAALVVANPVVVCQLLTLYVDGFLFLALVCLAGSLLLLVRGVTGVETWAVLALGSVLAVNTKSPGLADALFFVAAAAVPLGLRSRFREAAAASVLVVLVAATTGYHPYVQNLRDFGNPLYPTLGSPGRFGLEDQVAPQRPAGFQDASRLERLLVSVFARSDASLDAARVKLPWSWTAGELAPTFASPDVRKGGFGPLFALGLLCTLVALAVLGRGGGARAALERWSLPLILTASALIHPDGWWARYAPQLWLVPLTAAALSLAARSSPSRLLALVGVIVLAIDVASIARVNLGHNLWESRRMRRQLARAATLPEACFAIDPSFVGAIARLRELGIHARLVDAASCGPSRVLGNHARFCERCPPRAADEQSRVAPASRGSG